MARLELDFDTVLPPDRAIAALTDFSERRPDLWPSLAREYYRVDSVGETSAEVREGSTKPVRVWARERYDWSTPGKVTWTVEESNFCAPGSFVSAQVTPGPEGGSHVHVVWDRTPSNMKGRVLVFLIRMAKGKPISTSMKRDMDAMAPSQA
jgi:hypothetical protein